MTFDLSFKFMDANRNRKLLASVKTAGIKHRLDATKVLHFSSDDEDVVGNKLIKPLRDEQFQSWQVLSCPTEWTERYRQYMRKHRIPFSEELIDGETCFLISGHQTPLDWELPASNTSHADSRKKRYGNMRRHAKV